MVIDIEKRALNILSYLFYLKRIQRKQQGDANFDWKRAKRFLDYCKKRPNLIEKIME
jgi:hypothetical protein